MRIKSAVGLGSTRVDFHRSNLNHASRASLVVALLISLASSGCGTKPPGSPDSPAVPATDSTTAGAVQDHVAHPGAIVKTELQAKDVQASESSTTSQQGTAASTTKPKARTPVTPSAEQITRWALTDFPPLQLETCHDGFSDSFVQAMAISPDGKQFVLGGSKLTLWNIAETAPTVDFLASYKSDQIERPIRSMAISPDGKWLAAGDQKGMLRIWKMSDQSEAVAIRAHDARLTQMAFSPNSQMLATTSYSGEVRIWQTIDGKKIKSLKVGDQEVVGLQFLSDTLLATAGSEANIWNIDSEKKETILTKGYVRGPSLGLSSDRSLLAFGDAESKVQFWDASKSTPSGISLPGAAAHLIEFSNDGKWIATYSQDATIGIWDASHGKLVQVIDAYGGRITAMKWLPQTAALVVASERARIRIWAAPERAASLGLPPATLPSLEPIAAESRQSATSEQLQRVIDIRSFPRLPGAVPQWSNFGMLAYTAPSSQGEAELFYRYTLERAGWQEVAKSNPVDPGINFRKDNCALNVTLTAASAPPNGGQDVQVSLLFSGNYDVRWLPKISPIDSKDSYSTNSMTSYRTKAELTDVEVTLLKQFHEAGWTAYTRLNAAGTEDPNSRKLTLLQKGSVLNVFISRPADAADEMSVQINVSVSNKSLPIPTDSGWIEFDSSTELVMVANTKMDLKQTTAFYDTAMAAEGWLSREAGRQFKDDKGWLPYLRGQQDVFIRLIERPEGGTRIIVGDAEKSSWQISEPVKADRKAEKPGLEAADCPVPKGATAVKFEVDQKQIQFELPGVTAPKLAEEFAKLVAELGWKREDGGIVSDDYVLATFLKEKAEIQIRVRGDAKNAKTSATISGDALLWNKPLPTDPVRISYETWLRRNRKDATLDLLNEFSEAMHKLPADRARRE